MTDDNHNPDRKVPDDMPRQRSPFLAMTAIMAILIIVSVWELATEERISLTAAIDIPALNTLETQGQVAFNRECSDCHGVNATGGSKTGQPLMHPYYRTGIFSVEDFKRTIRQGAPQRLWKFGHMAPQPHITEAENEAMAAFFDALRTVNGMGAEN